MWTDVWLKKEPPYAAKIGILRKDFSQPLFAVARYEAYVQKNSDGLPNSIWFKMSDNQLAKCAESLGLRKAFPNQTSGLYTFEELPFSENQYPEPETEPKTTQERNLNEPPKVPKRIRTSAEKYRKLIDTIGRIQRAVNLTEEEKKAELIQFKERWEKIKDTFPIKEIHFFNDGKNELLCVLEELGWAEHADFPEPILIPKMEPSPSQIPEPELMRTGEPNGKIGGQN
ncbi:recombinase RecT [Leptospira ellisii]|uniref:recombinase RecT n=1 Tax=Leptospira ellisii TaxID=2023197 RepID=UPI0024341613|nr:recombinase RecT [Leptospira ellisii]